MAARETPIPGSVDRAVSTPEAVGLTAGDAETTSATVKAKKDQITCPNCGRVYDVRASMQGTTIPCLCGFLINVA